MEVHLAVEELSTVVLCLSCFQRLQHIAGHIPRMSAAVPHQPPLLFTVQYLECVHTYSHTHTHCSTFQLQLLFYFHMTFKKQCTLIFQLQNNSILLFFVECTAPSCNLTLMFYFGQITFLKCSPKSNIVKITYGSVFLMKITNI